MCVYIGYDRRGIPRNKSPKNYVDVIATVPRDIYSNIFSQGGPGASAGMILLLALLFALPDGGIASGIPNYTEHWFTQVIDHFNFLSDDTFKQRYLMTGKQTLKVTRIC